MKEDKLMLQIVRVCPGQHLAKASIWIMVAYILALFDIEPTKDEAGHEIPIRADCTDGQVRRVFLRFHRMNESVKPVLPLANILQSSVALQVFHTSERQKGRGINAGALSISCLGMIV